jgi:hypothetical protein
MNYKNFSHHSSLYIFPLLLIPLGINHLFKLHQVLKPRNKSIEDPVIKYYNKNKTRFLSSFTELSSKYNENIDPVFYIKTEFGELMKDNLNYLEKKWKTRILIEYTPRGNIIMFYNPYKMGFSYYCDSTGIPYPILNAVAMKYVIMFKCRDFFVDECFIQNSQTNFSSAYDSPLLPIYFTECNTKDSIVKKKLATNLSHSDGPFAKLKQYKLNPIIEPLKIMQQKSPANWIMTQLKYYINKTKILLTDLFPTYFVKPIIVAKENLIEVNNKPKKEYNYNRFMRVGNGKDFKILPTIKNYSNVNGFQSNLLENLTSETKLQKQVMSYKDYKNYNP